MSFSYKPLWKKTIDCNINKTQLRDKAGITNASLSRLSKNEHVSMETLDKLCRCLDCEINEIIEHIKDEEKKYEQKI